MVEGLNSVKAPPLSRCSILDMMESLLVRATATLIYKYPP